ncbi:hypothetical protein [Pseudomonas phage PPpW-3]|uniref:HTH iclR-type domain-containing protein n=1 Tax=Pseudomonas phage PPpW-3 TaxID=1279082 RepID=V5YTJ2_9CAUD|nr:hypothetical protein X916_gp33 [Pseudomonas phage PPpW-3]BAO20633.1 hypothetical protein [Pseudomonas phage PPpW-3]
MLDIMRVYCSTYFPERHFGTCANDLLLCAAVLVGQAEGRPLNASKLADFVGIPRPSVIRKMAAFESIGLVKRCGGTFTLDGEVVNGRDAMEAIRFSTHTIVSAAEKLAKVSKMDTKAIAARSIVPVLILGMILNEGVAIAMNT